MPTDPYVPERREDAPRQEPNLAPGVKIPPARAWWADRPGDLPAGQPHGALLGSPGPNVGYALTLAERARDRMVLGRHEHGDDALAVVGEIAMKRAAALGRAPVMPDVDVAMTVLGYQGGADDAFAEWRARAVHGAHHQYDVRRTVVDAVPDDVLLLPHGRVAAEADRVREALRNAVSVPA